MNYNKILIIGDAGRGKTTLAKKLSKKLNIPSHSTDDYFWEVKFSKPRDRQKSVEQISELYRGDRWIVEGTATHLIMPGLETSDMIIQLIYKGILYQNLILLHRYFSRGDESFLAHLKLMKHTFYKKYSLGYMKGKKTISELIAPYKDKTVTLSSFQNIEKFISDFPETERLIR